MNSPVSAPLDEIPDSRGFSLCGVSQNGTHRLKPVLLQPQKSNDVTTSVSYHLRKISEMPQKSPNVFYHLQTASPVTTCVSYHLRKKPGGGGAYCQLVSAFHLGLRPAHPWRQSQLTCPEAASTIFRRRSFPYPREVQRRAPGCRAHPARGTRIRIT
jgi:hypothetical protein